MRNGILEIIPVSANNEFSDEALRYAENYAFINLKIFSTIIVKLIDEKISMAQQLNTKVKTLNDVVASNGS